REGLGRALERKDAGDREIERALSDELDELSDHRARLLRGHGILLREPEALEPDLLEDERPGIELHGLARHRAECDQLAARRQQPADIAARLAPDGIDRA